MDVMYGFIHSEMDLKVLILYILRKLPQSVGWNELTDTTLLCDSAISYFDFTECLADLVRTGHVVKDSDDMYAVTDKGRENGKTMESSLPYSVRVRADKAAGTLADLQRRSSLIEASHAMRNRGGFTVRLSMSDGVGPILTMELLAGDDKQSAKIEKNFKKNAESIYNRIIEMLTEE